MKIIFLDIDGVVCSTQSFNTAVSEWFDVPDDENLFDGFSSRRVKKQFCPNFNMSYWPFGKEALSLIHKLTRENDEIKFVISSTWREGKTVEQLDKVFKLKGLHIPIIGFTKVTDGDRRDEIIEWVRTHEGIPITHWCAIDDIDLDITNHSVLTNFDNGFTKEDYDKVCVILELENAR